MTVADKLTALQTDITNARTAITAKGGTVTSGGGSSQLATDIATIPTGSSDPDYGTVTFLDMDGTVLYTYTRAQALALTALPANATHTGFTSQGWNMSLAQIQSDLTNYEHQDICVGSLYVTSDGKTRIYIKPISETMYFYFSQQACEIDWGDGTTESKSASTYRVTHTYSDLSNRVITLTYNSSSSLGHDNYNFIQTSSSSSDTYPYFFATAVYKIEVGENINRIERGITCGTMVEYVNVPSSVTHVGCTYYAPKMKIITGCSGGGDITSTSWGSLCNLEWMAGKIAGQSFSTYYTCKLKSIQISENATANLVAGELLSLCGKITVPNCITQATINHGLKAYYGSGYTLDSDGGIYYGTVLCGMNAELADGKEYTISSNTTRAVPIHINDDSNAIPIKCWKKLTFSPTSSYSSNYLYIYGFTGEEIVLDGSNNNYNFGFTFSDCYAKKITVRNMNIATLAVTGNNNYSPMEIIFENCSTTGSARLSCNAIYLGESFEIPDFFTSFNFSAKVKRLTIPDGLTLGYMKYAQVIDMTEYTSVPALGSSYYLPTDRDFSSYVVVVPDSLYDSWIVATNWSSVASHIVKESEYTD